MCEGSIMETLKTAVFLVVFLYSTAAFRQQLSLSQNNPENKMKETVDLTQGHNHKRNIQ